jgi:hypothetical protein
MLCMDIKWSLSSYVHLEFGPTIQVAFPEIVGLMDLNLPKCAEVFCKEGMDDWKKLHRVIALQLGDR